jgi:hypothetical protein
VKKKLIIFFLGIAMCAGALNAQTLEIAIMGAAAKMSRELPAGASVAVINFNSDSEKLNEHILNELYGAILRNRVVIPVRPNARQFQTIREGLNADGEPSGETAQSIGKLLGVQYLITGSIKQNGNLYNIVFNAVDLNAELQSQYQASINPRNDPELASFLNIKASQPTAGSTSQPKPVTIADIAGVNVPATGKTPVKAIAENAQYAGTVTWSPAVSGTFKPENQYTATITLTAKKGFTLEGVAANFFKVAGATTTNTANTGVVTAVFPATTAAIVNIASIAGVTVPKTEGIPVTAITETEQYGGTVTWSPAVNGTFKPDTQYTATITLTAKAGYALQGVGADFFKVAGATATNNSDTGVVTAVFPTTKNMEDMKLKTIGVSLGTAFDTPLVIGTLHGTIAPFRGSFFDLGVDAGYGTKLDDVEYFSLYPFVNFALFVPFPRTADGKRGGWYAGVGIGAMFANYTFKVAGSIWDTVIATNIVTGFNLFEMLDISYTIRTDFNLVNSKLSVGYVYRFK